MVMNIFQQVAMKRIIQKKHMMASLNISENYHKEKYTEQEQKYDEID